MGTWYLIYSSLRPYVSTVLRIFLRLECWYCDPQFDSPLSAGEGVKDELRYGLKYRTRLSKESFGMSIFRMCTSV